MTRRILDSLLQRARAGARPMRPAWESLAIGVAGLMCLAVVQFLVGDRAPLDLLLVIAMGVLAGAAVLTARASTVAADRRHSESETFVKILQALSRSVDPDAIVDAIVAELGNATRADHVAVVRLRPRGDFLDATLVSMGPGSPTSNTLLPARLLEPARDRPVRGQQGAVASETPGEAAARAAGTGWRPRAGAFTRDADQAGVDAAERIGHRLRLDYGLRNTLAAPLRTDERLVGAIVLSRRTDDAWAPDVARLLESAARETSAALGRVYSYQAAEVRARTDELTQLPNRRYFDEYCNLVASRRRSTDHVAVLEIDVDHFKRLNDVYGHPAGDDVLRAIGAAIDSCVRDDDVPARYGGEEFVVLLRNPAAGVAYEIGERIREAVRAIDVAAVGGAVITVSVGVASARGPDETISAIVDRADRALYAAKRAGRDCVMEAAEDLSTLQG